MPCALCEREVPALTEHHLLPRATTKRKRNGPGPTIWICWDCHRQLHSLFELKQLARDLNSVELLREAPPMRTFLEWVRKQDPHKRVRVRGRRR